MPAFHAALRSGAGFAIAAIVGAGPAGAAGVYSTLYAFTGMADGATPNNSVTVDLAGNVYGAAQQGGIECKIGGLSYYGCGTIYKIDPSGKQTTLFSFTGDNGTAPSTRLTLIGNALYGGTEQGGKYGYGVLFGLHTDGTGFTVLHHFTGKDGAFPIGQLLPAGHGEGLYGVANQGGNGFNAHGKARDGELFELMRDGRLVILHAFNGKDGAEPSTILLDGHGTIFGGAFEGGTGCSLPDGCGTIYSYTPSTGQFTTLYQFTNKKDGLGPLLGSMDATGNLYGAAGGYTEEGTVFELALAGGGYQYRQLHKFTGTTSSLVASGPTLLADGSLVGTTYAGAGGILYLLDPAIIPSFKVVYSFPSDTPSGYAADALSQLIIGPRGVLYGTTSTGGATCYSLKKDKIPDGCGSVYTYDRFFSSIVTNSRVN